MDSVDTAVLKGLLGWQKNHYKTALITVTHTWGSSPRPIGSMMAIREGGAVIGSVSGGCIEDDVIRRYRHFPSDKKFELLTYGIDADEAHQFGLPCGGTVRLVVEFNPDTTALEQLLHHTTQGQLIQRQVDLPTGITTLLPTPRPETLICTPDTLVHVLGPAYRLLLIGAGQLSEYLATMALFNGFQVTVCDPRTEYSKTWSIPNVEITHEMPDDAVDRFAPDSRSCVVALTHDPKLDDMALLSALHSEAFYVGAIGSRKNTLTRRQRLIEYLDQPPAVVDKLHGPVGIYIGSKTPAEIAVSIMAEIIAIKNNVALPRHYNINDAKAQADVLTL